MTFRPMLRNEKQSGQFFEHEQICAQKTKAEQCDVLFIQTMDTRQLSAWIKDLRDDMIFSARMRNMGQLIRWMEFLSQTNRLSN